MTSPKTLLKAWNVRPKKSMGQNFLLDERITSAIVSRGKVTEEDLVVEIGAGLGAITIPLAGTVKHVFAVEPDATIAHLLHGELLASQISNVTIIQRDILTCRLAQITGKPKTPFLVFGNLPYHISSPVLVYLVKNRHLIDRALLMFQRELADRIMAFPGNKSYGRLSVLIAYCAQVKSLLQIPASAFFPKPNVDSTLVEIRFFRSPPVVAKDETFLFRVVRAAFGKRRKTLKNALKASDLHIGEDALLQSFELVAINPMRRAETLSVEEFVRLSDQLGMFAKPQP